MGLSASETLLSPHRRRHSLPLSSPAHRHAPRLPPRPLVSRLSSWKSCRHCEYVRATSWTIGDSDGATRGSARIVGNADGTGTGTALCLVMVPVVLSWVVVVVLLDGACVSGWTAKTYCGDPRGPPRGRMRTRSTSTSHRMLVRLRRTLLILPLRFLLLMVLLLLWTAGWEERRVSVAADRAVWRLVADMGYCVSLLGADRAQVASSGAASESVRLVHLDSEWSCSSFVLGYSSRAMRRRLGCLARAAYSERFEDRVKQPKLNALSFCLCLVLSLHTHTHTQTHLFPLLHFVTRLPSLLPLFASLPPAFPLGFLCLLTPASAKVSPLSQHARARFVAT